MMKMVHILPRSREPRGLIPKGQWKDGTVDGKPRVVVSCPTCGMVSHLVGYSITNDGTVSPTFECKFCHDFFSTIQLEDWEK